MDNADDNRPISSNQPIAFIEKIIASHLYYYLATHLWFFDKRGFFHGNSNNFLPLPIKSGRFMIKTFISHTVTRKVELLTKIYFQFHW